MRKEVEIKREKGEENGGSELVKRFIIRFISSVLISYLEVREGGGPGFQAPSLPPPLFNWLVKKLLPK